MAKRWMTVKEAAAFFEVQPLTIREWCRTGRLKATRPGRAWRIRPQDVYDLAQIKYGDGDDK